MQGKDFEKILGNISKNLKALRAENSYTQLEVSMKIGLERFGYQKIEYCQVKDIKLSTIIKILDLYNIPFENLIS